MTESEKLWYTALYPGRRRPGLAPGGLITGPPAKPKRGDVVTLTVTAYVRKVNDDGTLALAETPDPFADPLTLDRCHPSRVTIRRAAEPEPRVGDVITGATVKATPWRRGTIIRCVSYSEKASALVLLGDGRWWRVDNDDRNGTSPTGFDELGDSARFRVEHAPGKAAA